MGTRLLENARKTRLLENAPTRDASEKDAVFI